MTVLFSGKLICDYCNKKMRGKLARKKRIYVCSTWSNFGKNACRQNKVEQDLLLELLQLRYGKVLTQEEVNEKVKEARINEDKVEIIVNDGDTILLTDTHGSF